ncbi:MAG: alpha/beta fold hydrolase [Planctomycetota bacterium]|nr:alpha/beta fold hydrolase [Planctomycetota bacterium]
MMHHSFHLQTKDGLQLAANEWRPQQTPLFTVMLVHGQGEHLQRYHLLGEVLSEKGARVVGVDLRGHGLSEGKRGHINHWSDYFLDLDPVNELLPEQYHILGHSMGGLIALGYGLRNSEKILSIAASGPLLGVNIQPAAWKEALSGVLSRVWPSLPFDSEIPMDELCSDPEAVQRFADDALRVTVVTPRWYTEMKQEITEVFRMAQSSTTSLDLHMGELESIVSPSKVRELFENWACRHKNITIHAGACHELFQEPSAESTILQIFESFSKSSKK